MAGDVLCAWGPQFELWSALVSLLLAAMDLDNVAALPKRRRFSIEPDVQIEVGDEIFRVHSYVLMSQSSVFHQMLSGGMCEATSGRISLAGKSKLEFKEFLRHLQCPGSSAPPEIEPNVAKWLVRWADEYDVSLLKKRCEEALVDQFDTSWDDLELATKFGLERLRRACLQNISSDPFPHRSRLLEILKQTDIFWDDSDEEDRDDGAVANKAVSEAIAGDAAAEPPAAAAGETQEAAEQESEDVHPHKVFKLMILPRLYEAAFLEKPELDALSGPLSVENLWPIVVRALELAEGWNDVEQANRAARHAAALEKEVLKAIPMNLSMFENRKVTLRDIHSKCKDATTSSQQQLNDVLEALDRRDAIRKRGPHFYYDYRKLQDRQRFERVLASPA